MSKIFTAGYPRHIPDPLKQVASGKVRCISLWQPWASLIAIGAKQIETRHWSTSYRGPLLIHAAKTKVAFKELEEEFRSDYEFEAWYRSCLKLSDFQDLHSLPLGALVCVVDLTDCVPSELLTEEISTQERAFGNYGPNRFGWILKNIRAFPKPIPLRGQQGMWDVEIELDAALRGEIENV